MLPSGSVGDMFGVVTPQDKADWERRRQEGKARIEEKRKNGLSSMLAGSAAQMSDFAQRGIDARMRGVQNARSSEAARESGGERTVIMRESTKYRSNMLDDEMGYSRKNNSSMEY